MLVHCTWTLHVLSGQEPAVIAAEVERVMDQLLDLEQTDPRLGDSGVGLALDTMTAEMTLSAEGTTLEDAVGLALSAMRTAIHAAGGFTPDWPSITDVLSSDDVVPSAIAFTHGSLTVA